MLNEYLNPMITRPMGMQFATRPELMSELQMGDERYEKVCQFLEDFELIQYRANVGMLWGDIRPTKLGRRVMHEKSLESLVLTQSPVVNYHSGDEINITNTGESVAIAAGRQATARQGLTATEVENLFKTVVQELEQKTNLSDTKKQEIKETVELIEGEIQRGTDVNEKALTHYFATLARIAPDILEVVIATTANPVLGITTVIKKSG